MKKTNLEENLMIEWGAGKPSQPSLMSSLRNQKKHGNLLSLEIYALSTPVYSYIYTHI